MWSLLSGHINRLVEKIIAVLLTDFCNFFLQLSLSERVSKSVTLDKWLSCINMEFKNHYKKLNDIRRSQTHNLLLIKHFKPFSLWKGQSNSCLNQKPNLQGILYFSIFNVMCPTYATFCPFKCKWRNSH